MRARANNRNMYNMSVNYIDTAQYTGLQPPTLYLSAPASTQVCIPSASVLTYAPAPAPASAPASTATPAPAPTIALATIHEGNPFSDFTVNCPDGQFDYSKYLLYSVPYFKAMFSSQGLCDASANVAGTIAVVDHVDSQYSVDVMKTIVGIGDFRKLSYVDKVALLSAMDFYGITSGISDVRLAVDAVIPEIVLDRTLIARAWDLGDDWVRKRIRTCADVNNIVAAGISITEISAHNKREVMELLRAYSNEHVDAKHASDEILRCLAAQKSFRGYKSKHISEIASMLVPEDREKFRQMVFGGVI